MMEQVETTTEEAEEARVSVSKADIELLCSSKAEELQMLGYEYVTSSEVWECVSAKYKKSGKPGLHQVVNDILSLKPTQLMNYLTMEAYRGSPFS